MNSNVALLEEYLPENTALGVWSFIEKHHVKFRIARPRKSKLGDYRPPQNGYGHRISINADLNPYAFLLTVLHEFAHLTAWEKYKNRIKPHGAEWKRDFQEIIQPYLEQKVFPEKVEAAIINYMNNPAASSCVDHNLARALSGFDVSNTLFVEDLPIGATFRLANGLVFEKGERLRKRFRCKCLTNKKWYYVSPSANVTPINTQTSLF